jgi:hypothetical protein
VKPTLYFATKCVPTRAYRPLMSQEGENREEENKGRKHRGRSSLFHQEAEATPVETERAALCSFESRRA